MAVEVVVKVVLEGAEMVVVIEVVLVSVVVIEVVLVTVVVMGLVLVAVVKLVVGLMVVGVVLNLNIWVKLEGQEQTAV